MKTLDDVRECCAFIGQLAANDPAEAAQEATVRLADASAICVCSQAEILMSRGSAYRVLGKLRSAERDFLDSLQACRCKECHPRLLRRWAPLWAMQGDDVAADAAADEAVYRFALDGDVEWTMRARYTRAIIRFFAGRLVEALEDAEVVYRYYSRSPRAHPLHYGCAAHELAALLMASGDWKRALEVLNADGLKYVNGFRVLKLRLRWAKILAEIELGTASVENGNHRISRVLRELLGLGLPVAAADAPAEVEKAIRAKKRNLPHILGATSDAALLGATTAARLGAREALHLLPEDDDAEDLRRLLSDLGDLAETTSPDVEQLRRLALDIRARCSSAPTLPPRLTV